MLRFLRLFIWYIHRLLWILIPSRIGVCDGVVRALLAREVVRRSARFSIPCGVTDFIF